jgi:hypothetical protein
MRRQEHRPIYQSQEWFPRWGTTSALQPVYQPEPSSAVPKGVKVAAIFGDILLVCENKLL